MNLHPESPPLQIQLLKLHRPAKAVEGSAVVGMDVPVPAPVHVQAAPVPVPVAVAN